MFKDKLILALLKNFPDVPFAFFDPPEPIAVLGSNHPKVGRLEIHDDATVCISEITHGHFDCCYDPQETLTDEQIDEKSVEAIIDFLKDLFSDHVLLYRGPKLGFGGWSVFKDIFDVPFIFDMKSVDPNMEYFLWSGPYKQETFFEKMKNYINFKF